MAIKYLRTSSVKNTTVLLRPDLNCPVENGEVTDDFRIVESLPTIKKLIADGNKLIICGHLGRPKGQWDRKISFKPVAKKLSEYLKIKFVETGAKIPEAKGPHLIFYTGNLMEGVHRQQIQSAKAEDVVFLENMRFYKQEEENDSNFAKQLASLAEIYPHTIGASDKDGQSKIGNGVGVYVNDAFGVDHHSSVSVSGIPKYLPAYAGLLLEKEIKSLDAILKNVHHPFVVMTGGIKLSEKIGALKNLGEKADKILVGGGVASLIFKAKGLEVGISKIEEGEIKTAWQIEKNFKDKLILPLDVVVADEKMDKNSIRVCAPFEVRKNEMILDVGPKTILAFSKEIKLAKTIVWSGPMGLFEKKPFHTATMALARLIGGRGKGRAFVVAGGGETVDAIRQAHQFEHIDHVSTGGGAMLEYLAGKKLPGIEALAQHHLS